MYGNQYMYNPYNPQMSVDRINNQIKELENMRNQVQNFPSNQIPTNLTQNFQLAPNSPSIKYVNSVEDVKKELVFNDTLFPNREYTQIWLKNAKGDIKTYNLIEIVEKDEKDLKIEQLMAKIDMLEKEMVINETRTNVNEDVNGESTIKKSTISKSNK